MPASRHTDAEKIAIVQECDQTPRGPDAQGAVARRYGIALRTLVLWKSQDIARKFHATPAEIRRARRKLNKAAKADTCPACGARRTP